MTRKSIRGGLTLAVLLTGSAQAAAPQVPAAAFAALPQVSDVQLSPDGRLLAWRDQSGPGVKVVIFDIAAGKYRRTLTIDSNNTLRSLVWADDDTLLVNVSRVDTVMYEGAHRYAFAPNAARGEMGTRLVDTRADSGWVRDQYQIDTRTGKAKLLDRGDRYSQDWVVNAAGVPVARSEWQPAQNRYLIETPAGGERSTNGWHRRDHDATL